MRLRYRAQALADGDAIQAHREALDG